MDLNGNEDEITILEALQPHPNLKNLQIDRYIGSRDLSVMSTYSIKQVGLEFFGATMETEQVNNIDPISKSSIVSFSRLRRLKFWVNRQWKERVGYSGAATNLAIMPCQKQRFCSRFSRSQTAPKRLLYKFFSFES